MMKRASSVRPKTLTSSQSNAKKPEIKYEKYTAETNMQFMKQRLAVIKSVMDESDFQLQTKIKANKKLDLAYKNTAEDDLADEEESEEDEFTQQINKMLEL